MTGFQRTDRVAALIKAEIGALLLREVQDPTVANVAISAVKVTRDLSYAHVYFLVLGVEEGASEKTRAAAAKGLNRAKGFLRRELAQRISLRTMPELIFVWDDSVERGRHMEEVFAELERERANRPPVDGQNEDDGGDPDDKRGQ
jgi:ribosome-binding factor A